MKSIYFIFASLIFLCGCKSSRISTGTTDVIMPISTDSTALKKSKIATSASEQNVYPDAGFSICCLQVENNMMMNITTIYVLGPTRIKPQQVEPGIYRTPSWTVSVSKYANAAALTTALSIRKNTEESGELVQDSTYSIEGKDYLFTLRKKSDQSFRIQIYLGNNLSMYNLTLNGIPSDQLLRAKQIALSFRVL